MSLKLSLDHNQLLVLTISGKYLFSDFQQLSNEVAENLQFHTDVDLLIIFDQFEGWEDSDQWADTAIEDLAGKFIRKVAVVAEKRWHAEIEMFGLMDFQQWPFKFFTSEQISAAKDWLQSSELS